MLVLLTNDDGIDAPGLNALAASLAKHSHEVWIVAPASNRSGVSHGISLSEPLKVKKHGERVFSCSGKPADCVIAALDGLLPRRPDAVLSGINCGANIGTDIIFSGTAAAARQAAIHGIPAIAVSLIVEEVRMASPPQWEGLADFTTCNLEAFAKVCGEDVFANVNAVSLEAYKGFKITGLCRRIYHDVMRFSPAEVKEENAGNCFECVFEGGSIETISSPGDDWDAVKSGYISVSPVSAQPAVAENLLDAFISAPFCCNSAV